MVVVFRIVVLWLFLVAGLWLASRAIPGVAFRSPLALWAGGLVLGILDVTAGPVLFVVTFPLTVITLGLFVFIVNAAVVSLASLLVPGFEVKGGLPAFYTGLIVAGHALAGYLVGLGLTAGGIQMPAPW